MRAIENDGVGGGLHRRQVALGVAGVAGLLRLEDRLQTEQLAARLHVALSPARALARIGDEEEFTGRVWKDNRTLITALANHVSPGRDGSLQFA